MSVHSHCQVWRTKEGATNDLHSLGFPIVGRADVEKQGVTVTVTTAVLEDDLESYEEAVLEWAVPLEEEKSPMLSV